MFRSRRPSAGGFVVSQPPRSTPSPVPPESSSEEGSRRIAPVSNLMKKCEARIDPPDAETVPYDGEWCPNACLPRCISVTARWRCASSTCPNCPPPTRSSRSRTAASAAPTCTWCSRSTRGPTACSATNGRARSSRSGADVHGWELGARVVQNPGPGCGECRACRRGRPSVCLRREPTDHLAWTSGAFCRYKVVPASRLLARARIAVDAGGRAHRTHGDRDSHRQPVGRHARRPRVGDRRRSGRPAHHRRAPSARHRRRHRVRARAAAARTCTGGRSAHA